MSPTTPTLVKSGAVPRKPVVKPLFKHKTTSYLKDDAGRSSSVSEAKATVIRKAAVEGSRLQKPKAFGSVGTSSTKL